jgi:hypothetical protein
VDITRSSRERNAWERINSNSTGDLVGVLYGNRKTWLAYGSDVNENGFSLKKVALCPVRERLIYRTGDFDINRAGELLDGSVFIA